MSKKILVTLVFVLILASFLWLLLSGIQAYAFGGVFGGIVSLVKYCTCSVGHVITVGSPRPGVFHFVPGKSQLFAYGQIASPGVWVLGTVSGTSPCLMWVGSSCVPVPNEGDIGLVGTSR